MYCGDLIQGGRSPTLPQPKPTKARDFKKRVREELRREDLESTISCEFVRYDGYVKLLAVARARQYCAMLSVVYSSIVYNIRRCLPLRTGDGQAGMLSLRQRNVVVVHYSHRLAHVKEMLWYSISRSELHYTQRSACSVSPVNHGGEAS